MNFSGAVHLPENPDVAAHYGSFLTEQRAWEEGRGIGDLSGMVGLIAVTGPDRLAWLNGLTSQKLDALAPGESTQTLFLDAHGHIENMAGVVDDGETSWLFAEAQQVEQLATWLESMRFRSRVEVTDVTEHYERVAVPADPASRGAQKIMDAALVSWEDPWPRVLDGGTRYGPSLAEHPHSAHAVIVSVLPKQAWATLPDSTLEPVGAMAFNALRIAAWQPSSAEYADGRTLPHELDWLRTSVHLHKGCYRGQETVARVHNVGHPPRRLVMLHLDGSISELPPPGEPLFTIGPGQGRERGREQSPEQRADKRPVGFVSSAALHYELGPIALALVKRTLDPEALLRAGDVAAAQQLIVPPSGVSTDRPHTPRLPGVPRPASVRRRGLL